MMAILKKDYELEHQNIDHLRNMSTTDISNKYHSMRIYFTKWCLKNNLKSSISQMDEIESILKITNSEKFDLLYSIVIDILEKEYHQKGLKYQALDDWWNASESEKVWCLLGYPLKKQDKVPIDDIIATWKGPQAVLKSQFDGSDGSQCESDSSHLCVESDEVTNSQSTVKSDLNSSNLFTLEVIERFEHHDRSSICDEVKVEQSVSVEKISEHITIDRENPDAPSVVDDIFIEVENEEVDEDSQCSDWIYVPENSIVNLVL